MDDLEKYKVTRDYLQSLIKNADNYYAHVSIDGSNKEKLLDHLLLVQDYFFSFIAEHKLDHAINLFIRDIADDTCIQNLIVELFLKSVVFHDFGKVNPVFQQNKMNNKLAGFDHNLSSKHSLIGGYIFSIYSEIIAKKKKLPPGKELFVDYIILLLSYPILKHHSPSLYCPYKDLDYNEELSDLEKFITFFNGFDDNEFINEINECVFDNYIGVLEHNCSNNDRFSLYALLKLNYSLLTASDYYATTHYMKGWEKLDSDFGVFDTELKNKIIYNIENSKDYNKKVYNELENYKLEFPQEANEKNLNRLRQNLAVEIINGVRENCDKKLFYIEAPTGSGKTNLSILALAEFLRNDLKNGTNDITKIFYVFPFTTLITQTYSVLKETLGLESDEMVQIHSRAGFSTKSSDDDYGNDRDNLIDYQFVNYPVSLLSHIKFFDILKSNKKSDNYLLHRLANSIVIIDELQAYSPKEWDKIIYFINNYAKYFNIKFILMSATLPKIDKLLTDEAVKLNFSKEEFIYLNRQKDKYFKNPNFASRIAFDFSMLEASDFDKNARKEFLQKLWQKVKQESENYRVNGGQNRTHAIIEFIFKKTASEFFELVYNRNDFFDEILLLSGTTIEPRRREIIAKLKHDDYRKKNILLITTQVVEAGVDIDMDLGFKDSSLIDSDEQLAGRINRNVQKRQCRLFLFNLDDAKVIYGNDDRYKKVLKELSKDYFNILKNKNFDLVYDSVMKDRIAFNQSPDCVNLRDYLNSIKKLNFISVDKDFKLIDNEINEITIFIPLNIPLKNSYSAEKNFTDNEIDYLRSKGKLSEDTNYVSGDEVWALYESVIRNKDENFSNKKIQIVTLHGLISKFSISTGIYSKTLQYLKSYNAGEYKYGFYKLSAIDNFYDYESGFKIIESDDINFM